MQQKAGEEPGNVASYNLQVVDITNAALSMYSNHGQYPSMLNHNRDHSVVCVKGEQIVGGKFWD